MTRRFVTIILLIGGCGGEHQSDISGALEPGQCWSTDDCPPFMGCISSEYDELPVHYDFAVEVPEQPALVRALP
jgi:hypothetical protein